MNFKAEYSEFFIITETIFEQMVGIYTMHGDYFLPDITFNVYAAVGDFRLHCHTPRPHLACNAGVM